MPQAAGKNKKQTQKKDGSAWMLILALLLLLGALVMAIFASFPTPLITWITWFKINVGGQKVGFSVWGFCAEEPTRRLLIFDTKCPGVRPGWSFLDLQRIVNPDTNRELNGDVDKAISLIQDSMSGFTTSFTFLMHVFNFIFALFAFIIALALITRPGRAFLDKYPRHHFQGHHENGQHGGSHPKHYTFPTIATALVALGSTFLFIIDISIALVAGGSVNSAAGFETEPGLGIWIILGCALLQWFACVCYIMLFARYLAGDGHKHGKHDLEGQRSNGQTAGNKNDNGQESGPRSAPEGESNAGQQTTSGEGGGGNGAGNDGNNGQDAPKDLEAGDTTARDQGRRGKKNAGKKEKGSSSMCGNLFGSKDKKQRQPRNKSTRGANGAQDGDGQAAGSNSPDGSDSQGQQQEGTASSQGAGSDQVQDRLEKGDLPSEASNTSGVTENGERNDGGPSSAGTGAGKDKRGQGRQKKEKEGGGIFGFLKNCGGGNKKRQPRNGKGKGAGSRLEKSEGDPDTANVATNERSAESPDGSGNGQNPDGTDNTTRDGVPADGGGNSQNADPSHAEGEEKDSLPPPATAKRKKDANKKGGGGICPWSKPQERKPRGNARGGNKNGEERLEKGDNPEGVDGHSQQADETSSRDAPNDSNTTEAKDGAANGEAENSLPPPSGARRKGGKEKPAGGGGCLDRLLGKNKKRAPKGAARNHRGQGGEAGTGEGESSKAEGASNSGEPDAEHHDAARDGSENSLPPPSGKGSPRRKGEKEKPAGGEGCLDRLLGKNKKRAPKDAARNRRGQGGEAGTGEGESSKAEGNPEGTPNNGEPNAEHHDAAKDGPENASASLPPPTKGSQRRKGEKDKPTGGGGCLDRLLGRKKKRAPANGASGHRGQAGGTTSGENDASKTEGNGSSSGDNGQKNGESPRSTEGAGGSGQGAGDGDKDSLPPPATARTKKAKKQSSLRDLLCGNGNKKRTPAKDGKATRNRTERSENISGENVNGHPEQDRGKDAPGDLERGDARGGGDHEGKSDPSKDAHRKPKPQGKGSKFSCGRGGEKRVKRGDKEAQNDSHHQPKHENDAAGTSAGKSETSDKSPNETKEKGDLSAPRRKGSQKKDKQPWWKCGQSGPKNRQPRERPNERNKAANDAEQGQSTEGKGKEKEHGPEEEHQKSGSHKPAPKKPAKKKGLLDQLKECFGRNKKRAPRGTASDKHTKPNSHGKDGDGDSKQPDKPESPSKNAHGDKDHKAHPQRKNGWCSELFSSRKKKGKANDSKHDLESGRKKRPQREKPTSETASGSKKPGTKGDKHSQKKPICSCFDASKRKPRNAHDGKNPRNGRGHDREANDNDSGGQSRGQAVGMSGNNQSVDITQAQR